MPTKTPFDPAVHTEDQLPAADGLANFNKIGKDLIESEIAKKYLSAFDIAKLRTSCRFFGFKPKLKEYMEDKRWKVAVNASQTIFFRKDEAFIMGNCISTIPGERKADSHPLPLELPNHRPLTKIVVGRFHALFLDDQGHCFGFGENETNALGQYNTLRSKFNEMKPIVVSDDMPIIDIAAGTDVTFLKTKDNKWYGLGSNNCGQRGTSTSHDQLKEPTLIQLPNKKAITKIINQNQATFMCDSDGEWFKCGYSLLDGISPIVSNMPGLQGYCMPSFNFVNSPTPVPINNYLNDEFVDVILGDNTIFLLSRNNKWYMSGDNSDGKLGCKDPYINFLAPVNLPNKKSIIKIVTGENQNFFCDNEGQWHGCGYGGYGNLGLSEERMKMIAPDVYVKTPTPIFLPNMKPIVQVVPSIAHTFFCDNEGNWYGCGVNNGGELGLDHNIGKVYNPVPIDFDQLIQTNKETATMRPRM